MGRVRMLPTSASGVRLADAVKVYTRRHVHRAVPQAAPPEPPATGVDYLGLVAAAHEEAADTGAKIDFTALGRLTAGEPGQQQDHGREPEEPR